MEEDSDSTHQRKKMSKTKGFIIEGLAHNFFYTIEPLNLNLTKNHSFI